MFVCRIGIVKCFLFNGVTEATGSDEGGKRVEHKFRHGLAKELLRYPAYEHDEYKKGDDDFSKREASVFVPKDLFEKSVHDVLEFKIE